ncbi:AMP-dependent synthetase and ligase [Truepera radiovictrix DSM 17093]|uniref:AMP-dependent synthetase and ligase n=1 Tax=Truepera radiovictrix (strain DSM 17093 / CIP 108686 / LMG 22925 / RQ-24) TaxID=649638 RepID=D7CSU3_TRURR|nr:AMP-dependent synthetase and ligase [Truepera radiovictrix DSM 17093]
MTEAPPHGVSVTEARCLPALLAQREHDPGIAHRVKRLGLWQRIPWSAYARSVWALARQLIALGVEPGDRVAILSENRPEWLVADLAIQSAGGISVGIYTTNSAAGVRYVLAHSGAVGVILENAEQLEKWREVRASLPALRFAIALEPEGATDALAWDALMREAEALYARDPEPVAARVRALTPHDTALLMYTSGTTGNPKGVQLSHGNLLWSSASLTQALGYTARDEALSYLPLSHIVERNGAYAQLRAGFVISFVESLETFAQNLQEVRPTVLFAVPRVWEKLHARVELHMRENHTLKRALYSWALRAAHGPRRGAQRTLADLTVIHWLRLRLGLDRVRVAISGAAPISPSILLYFRALGLDLREGYGMTENSGLATIHQGEFRMGTVGTPFPGVEVRVAEDGEILTRSPGTFQGYWNDPEATAEAMAGDWLRTGDVGELDDAGHLRITDRKKDILITAGGKNIAPQKLENLLKASPFIGDAVVIGDGRKYLVALLVLDEDNVGRWATDKGVSYTTYTDLTRHPEVVKLIEGEVAAVNKGLARVETLKRFAILPKRLHFEDGEVTATMKVKRRAIAERYRDLIESLYEDAVGGRA